MYKKIIVLAAFSVGFGIALTAQPGFVNVATTNSYQVFDANGKVFVNPGIDVAGSPYYNDQWTAGSAVTSKGQRFDGIRLRLDLHTQEVHYLDSAGKELVLPKGFITEVIWGRVAAAGDSARFQCGFPATELRGTGDFYLVLCSGRCWLLQSVTKTISEEKDEMSGEIKKEYVSYEDYYVCDGSQMIRVKKDKSAILALLAGQQSKIQNFVETNHLRLKSIDEIKRLIDYYNSL